MGRYKPVRKKATLNITSMMDFMTIILLFLIANYSAEGSILTNADDLVLPNSASKKKPQDVNLQIAVTQEKVLVDNQYIVETKVLRNIAQDEHDPSNMRLEEKLKQCMADEEEMVRRGALNQTYGKIIVQVDKNIEFDVVYKVMNVCGKTGYNNMNFAVMERDG
jgi:biopolymer transport protein ExbD